MPGGLHPPLSVIESWPKPNYVDPVVRGNALSTLSIMFIIISVIIVTARLWARFFVLRKPGWDDGLICFAIVPTIGLGVCFILAQNKYGFERHIWDVPPSIWEPAALLGWVIELLYHLSTSFTKIPILLFYRRMTARSSSSTFMRVLYAALAFQVIWTVVFTIVLCMACKPLNAYWLRLSTTPYTVPHMCIQEGVYWPLSVGISVITDFVATLLPCWFFWTLQLPLTQKISLYSIFSLGFLTCISGIFRFVFVIRELDFTYDAFWEGYVLWIVSAAEVNGAIWCASAPALKPLFDKYFTDLATCSFYVRSVKEMSWRSKQSETPGTTANGGNTPVLYSGTTYKGSSTITHDYIDSNLERSDAENQTAGTDFVELSSLSSRESRHWPLG